MKRAYALGSVAAVLLATAPAVASTGPSSGHGVSRDPLADEDEDEDEADVESESSGVVFTFGAASSLRFRQSHMAVALAGEAGVGFKRFGLSLHVEQTGFVAGGWTSARPPNRVGTGQLRVYVSAVGRHEVRVLDTHVAFYVAPAVGRVLSPAGVDWVPGAATGLRTTLRFDNVGVGGELGMGFYRVVGVVPSVRLTVEVRLGRR